MPPFHFANGKVVEKKRIHHKKRKKHNLTMEIVSVLLALFVVNGSSDGDY